MNQQCLIGDNSNTGIRLDPMPGVLYLNEATQAECPGNISRVRYCYHNSPNTSTNSTRAEIAVYRRRWIIYNRISQVFTTSGNTPFNYSQGLVCEYVNLGMAITVKRGDVFGVCLPNQGVNEVLPIVSESSGSLSTLPCQNQPPDSFNRFSLSVLSNARLHIYADLSKNTCHYLVHAW